MTHQAYGAADRHPADPPAPRPARRAGDVLRPGLHAPSAGPAICRAIRDAGHEIAHHGYLHEGAHGADAAEQERRLLRGLEALDAVLGVRPTGYRAPIWELTYDTPAHPRPARVHLRLGADGRRPPVPPRDVAGRRRSDDRRAARPLVARRLGAVQLPARDHRLGRDRRPRPTSSARWTLELEALVAEGGLFMLTNHPFVSGRASRAAALETADRPGPADRRRSGSRRPQEIAAHTATLNLAPVVHRKPELPFAPAN